MVFSFLGLISTDLLRFPQLSLMPLLLREFLAHDSSLCEYNIDKLQFLSLFWQTHLIPFFFLRGQNLMGYVDGSILCLRPTLSPPIDDASSGGATSIQIRCYLFGCSRIRLLYMSVLAFSLSKEFMYLTVGRWTSLELWTAMERALASSSCARALNLLG